MPIRELRVLGWRSLGILDAHSGALSLSLGPGTGIGPATHAKS